MFNLLLINPLTTAREPLGKLTTHFAVINHRFSDINFLNRSVALINVFYMQRCNQSWKINVTYFNKSLLRKKIINYLNGNILF